MRIKDGSPIRRLARVLVGAFILLANLHEQSAPSRTGVEVQLAYLDPAVGSLILQGLIAAFAAAAVALRLYWKKIKRLLGFPTVQAEKKDTEPQPPSDE